MEPPLSPEAILAAWPARTLPRTVTCHGSVGSTMDLARRELARLAPADLPALVVADEQTAGRGRMGRTWVAPPGTALLLSLALRPTWLAPTAAVQLVWMTAVALCEAVEQVSTLRPALKWPNDLLLPVAPSGAWAKAAGILLEVGLGQAGVETAIIGCGINLSAAPPPELTRMPATSLHAAAGLPITRLDLLRALLERLDSWYTHMQAGEAEALFGAWRERLVTPGQLVRVETPGGLIEGRAESVLSNGALLVRDAAGAEHTITSGDVGLVG